MLKSSKWKLQKGNRGVVLQKQGNYANSSYQINRFMSVAGVGSGAVAVLSGGTGSRAEEARVFV